MSHTLFGLNPMKNPGPKSLPLPPISPGPKGPRPTRPPPPSLPAMGQDVAQQPTPALPPHILSLPLSLSLPTGSAVNLALPIPLPQKGKTVVAGSPPVERAERRAPRLHLAPECPYFDGCPHPCLRRSPMAVGRLRRTPLAPTTSRAAVPSARARSCAGDDSSAPDGGRLAHARSLPRALMFHFWGRQPRHS